MAFKIAFASRRAGDRRILGSLLAGAFAVTAWAAAPAHAQSAKLYSFGNTKEISGVIIDGNKLFVSLGNTSNSGLIDASRRKQLVAMSLAGGSGCKTMKFAEIGVLWQTNSCVTVKKRGAGSYDISVLTKHTFLNGNLKNKDEVKFLKEEDFVKERKQTLSFSYSGSSCSGTVKSRFYKPVDGNNWVPSRTGAIECSAS